MKKKEVITTRGIRFWSPIQVRIPQNRAPDDTWCCPCGIVTLNAIVFNKVTKRERITDIGWENKEQKMRGMKIRITTCFGDRTINRGKDLYYCLGLSDR